MNTQIQTFQFQLNQSVRVEMKDGEPLFCLKDVAEILEIQNTKQSRFNLKEDGVHKMYLTDKLGREQEATFINEPNLYRVIFRSNKEEAVKFQDWIFEKVIPQIRKTGSYAIEQAQAAALPHNPYTFSEEDAQALDMPLIQYVNKLIGYYCKHKGVSHAVIEKQLVTQFGHGNKDLRLQSKRCHLAAVTWLHEQLDQLPKVNFAVSREDLLHIFRQQCEYKKMFEGWNEDQLQRWLDVTFFSDSPRVLNYPRKLDNASYGQLEKLVGAMKAVLGDSFQLLAQECEPRRELSVSADLLVKVSDKLLKFQEFAECVETMAESLGYFMKDGNWRMVDCQLRCLSSLAYQALNENASTLADDLDGLLTA